MLIIFGGLPGSGKSTISSYLAKELSAVYLRIDSIETAINKSTLKVAQPENAGYLAAYDIAKDNLEIGNMVIADSVNPIQISRHAWRNTAIKNKKGFIEIEIICSDLVEHKQRLENRNADVNNTTPATTWEQIEQHEYEVWDTPNLRLDTSKLTTEECIQNILQHLKIAEL